jgi:hypothetical protein
MCFSATASFAAGAVLIPVGAHCINHASKNVPESLPFAAIPLVFGVQQLIEGLLWLSLGGSLDLTFPASFGFLFFAHFFWLWWVPFCVWRLESPGTRKAFALAMIFSGGVYGAMMYFPLLVNDGWLQVSVAKHSIVYEMKLIFDALMPREWVRSIYGLIVLVPLLIGSDRLVRYCGLLLLASAVVALLAFDHAYISVWCFFAALLSPYIVYMLHRQAREQANASAGPDPSLDSVYRG